MPRIQDQVAENRRDVQRIDGRFVFVPARRDENLSFGRNTVQMDVDVAVYTRSLGNSLVSGHPQAGRGSGRGVSGDLRGAWTLQEDVAVSADWTRAGRNATRDALAGVGGSIVGAVVGTGTTDASPSDTSLAAETGGTFAYGIRAGQAYNEVRARANFLFAETGRGGLDPQEFGLVDSSGRLLCRLTTDAVTVSPTEEVRVDITVTVTGGGNGTGVITEDGETAIVRALQLAGETVGLDEMAWGTGTTDPTKTDTSLENEVYRANVERTTSLETIEVSAPQFESQPNGQPYDYSEVGVFDNEGRLVYRTVFRPFEKTDNVRFITSVGFRIV